MTSTKLYLDKRSKNVNGECPLKILLTKHSKPAMFPVGVRIKPCQWDSEKQKVIDHPQKQRLNIFIQSKKNQFDLMLMELISKGECANLTAIQIKNKISDLLNPKTENVNLFVARFNTYMSKLNKESTIEKYQITLKRIKQFASNSSSLSFEDITKDWLTDFDNFLRQFNPSVNGRNIHFRNIRAVFNDAIDNDITSNYPFRKFKIKPEVTEKRSLSVEELRTLLTYPCEEWQQRYIDIFKLTFCLIGINLIDLCNLEEIVNGRIEYRRAKTNRLYNIKVEPEALSIINKYRGKSKLLCFAETFKTYKSFTMKIDKQLKLIGPVSYVDNPNYKKGGKKHKQLIKRNGLFSKLSLYWARHTWATIASELDIPKDTIAAALGHGAYTVTDIYISFDRKKIDEANRKVLDYVFSI